MRDISARCPRPLWLGVEAEAKLNAAYRPPAKSSSAPTSTTVVIDAQISPLDALKQLAVAAAFVAGRSTDAIKSMKQT